MTNCTSPDQLTVTSSPQGLLLDESSLAEYERNIDHRGLIEKWDDATYRHGQKIYRDVCFSCHGNENQPGSIPTATKFWSDSLKFGMDPYAMYQTLTRGYGLMVPQVNLVPTEKYAVIHFIRESFMKPLNENGSFEVNSEYLDRLPKGEIFGPSSSEIRPWAEMDYGNFLIRTYELADKGDPPREISGGPSPLPNEDFSDTNFAYKGIAIRLDEGAGGVAVGKTWALFDHDLMRLAGIWSDGSFIDYEAILMNERHNIFPRTDGEVMFENPVMPGWSLPGSDSFEDPRFRAVDGRPFGPLPRDWTHYKGLYKNGDEVIVEYTVGESYVLEKFDLIDSVNRIISRSFSIDPLANESWVLLGPEEINYAIFGDRVTRTNTNGYTYLVIPPERSLNIQVYMSVGDEGISNGIIQPSKIQDLRKYKEGGPAQFSEELSTPIITGKDDQPYTTDVLTLPLENPWNARVRPSGIDFIPDTDEAVVCTIDGDVWKIRNISQQKGNLRWKRIATGLFQPLGIKYHRGEIYVGCRDQIVRLRDLNGDEETDYYQSFNSDHQVTEHFHEFAMGLQVDEDDQFYYAKSARHARTALIPQHGTLIRVSPDGNNSEIIANGFRAANGVCRNPDGSFYVTDQEGYWNPMNRINLVEEGGFYGNMYGYGAPSDSSDAAMIQPLCWIDMKYDRSPAELLWVESEQWGPLNGHLLNLSYGYGKVFVVLTQKVDNTPQGGIVELPVPQFPTGLIRGRFHPKDGQLYTCGMTAWATSQVLQAGGLYRIRYTGKQLTFPVALKATTEGVEIKFSSTPDKKSALDTKNYEVSTWQLERTRRYGSKRYDTKTLEIQDVVLDGNTVRLQIPEIAPTWIMEIKYSLEDRSGKELVGAIQNSIYALENKQVL